MKPFRTINWLLVLLAFWSSFSFAYDSATCSDLTSKSNFSATFNFTTTVDANNEPINPQTVYAERASNDNQSIALWSNGSTSALINDTITRQPGTYTVWLTYDESSNNQGQNKQGQLTFYILSSGSWLKKVGPVTADLSSFSDIHIDVNGDNLRDLQCDASLNEPEVSTEPPVTLDVCEYFPQPIQSWITEGTVYSGYPESILDVQHASTRILGWSPNYLSDKNNIYRYHQPWENGSSWDTLRVGFDQVGNESIAYKDSGSRVCNDVMGCYPGNDDGNINDRKVGDPKPLVVDFDAQDEVTINNGTTDNNSFQRVCYSGSSICSYNQNSDGTIDIFLKKNLKSLNLNGWSNNNLTVYFENDIKIESLSYSGNISFYFTEFANTFFKKISGSGSIHWVFESGVTLNIVDSLSPSNRLFFDYKNYSDHFVLPVFYGPEANFLLRSSTDNNNELRAFILAKTIRIPNYIVMEGSITANYVRVDSGLTLRQYSQAPDCWDGGTTTDDSYSLTIEPSSDIALVCQDLSPTLSVMSDGALATDFTGNINVTIDGESDTYSVNNGSFSRTLTVSSGGASKTVTVTAYIEGDESNSTVTGSYQFVPYKLSADDQYVIANKPVQVTATAQACNDDGDVVDVGYSGTPTIQSSWVAPTDGVGSLTYAPTFSNGQSTTALTLEDAGTLTVTMTDSDVSCSDKDDCPIEGQTLTGQFTVYSRPWTFAICSSDNSAMDGNITDASSSAFTAAGNPFALHIRPLRWVSGGDDSDPVNGAQNIETSGYCSSPVAQNFFSSDSDLTANVDLTYEVAAPSDGDDGSLSGTLTHSNSEGTDSTYLPFDELSWSEVGVLRVKADTQADYLGMNVNLGYRDIGRFYPAWLTLVSNEWNYADNHDGFMYMGQPVTYGFTVEARNMDDVATTNYSKFDPSLIADIKLLAVDTDNDNEELGSRVVDYDSQFWNGSADWSGSQLVVEKQPIEFSRLVNSSSPLTTTADGPYVDGFGLRVTDKVDGVDFKTSEGTNLELKSSGTVIDTGKPFPTEQPDIRYGRMVMDDVGGTSVSTINIPLRTEYWNGSRFVTNSDDSGSYYVTAGDYVCKKTVWSESGTASDSALQGADDLSEKSVSAGTSENLFAKPHSSTDSDALREQVRFWLRLDDDATTSPQTSESGVSCGSSYTSQPWLQYNWRNLGDEDPSSVVTFGIHRGNDRIIYRGETGLTGQ